MAGSILFEQSDQVGWVTLSHASRFNAMSRGMWRELRSVFELADANPDLRCIVVAGEAPNFCAGGDISEYAEFRFQEASLREFHESDVWGGLQAMLACDLPIVAQIEGNCMGAGIEIASCCDIRVAGISARFGAPIARLGFPMAPREAALVLREVGASLARQMLLEAAVLPASDMLAAGFLSRVHADQQVGAEVSATASRIVSLAPQAARLNKRTLRGLAQQCNALGATNATRPTFGMLDASYAYADSAEHREGILAFLEKRKPVF